MEAIEELLALARSPRPDVRADAGRGLVAFLGDQRADAALVALIQDPLNTLPTFDTATMLLQRGDDAGVRLLAQALADADQDSVTHSLDAMYEATTTQPEFDALLARVKLATVDRDPSIRRGAGILLGWFDRL